MPRDNHIRVLVIREEGHYVAQCLEYDIGAQADDLDELRVRLMVAVEAERQESIKRHGSPFAGLGPAPYRFYDLWERGREPLQPATLRNDPDINLEFGIAA